MADVAEPHDTVADALDGERIELVGTVETRQRLDRELHGAALDPARRQLDVLAIDGGAHVERRELVRAQLLGVDP